MLEKYYERLTEVVEEYGTPVYVYFEDILREKCRTFVNTFKKYFRRGLVAYAYKANSNPYLLKIIHEEGLGAEVVSGGELYIALKIGANPRKIVFDGVSKSLWELEQAVKNDIFLINIESLGEAEKLINLIRQKGKSARLGVRLNVDILAGAHAYIKTGGRIHKFGVDFKTLPKIAQIAGKYLAGLHAHIGSQIFDVTPYLLLIKRLWEAFSILLKEGVLVEVFDIGGGFGVNYQDSTTVSLEEFFNKISEHLYSKASKVGVEPYVIVEPGRYIVAQAGVLLTRVNYVKEVYGRKWILIDAGMNDFIRPAFYKAKHRITLLGKNYEELIEYNVGGPVCESSDIFGEKIKLPQVNPGDVIVIHGVGAYGYSMSSNYNMRPRPPEVLISSHGDIKLIRKRETLEDLLNQVP
ncbi:MAG TPA: diaminopimelate decarboxylase [Thermoproteales archaeon]|nr:diaminopimelate decarboxylase [Thermoproteales archaeon]